MACFARFAAASPVRTLIAAAEANSTSDHSLIASRSPEDSSQLESYGSSGPGQWITIWANSGHTYMQIAGLFFDTSGATGRSGDRWSRSNPSGTSGYVVRHPSGY